MVLRSGKAYKAASPPQGGMELGTHTIDSWYFTLSGLEAASSAFADPPETKDSHTVGKFT